MKSRLSVILSRIFHWFTMAFLILASYLRICTDLDLVVPAFLLFLFASVLSYLCTRCPHCRRFGLNPRPFDNTAGDCCRCGRSVEYGE